MEKFVEMWEEADRTKYTDQEIFNKVVTIQRHWRGYVVRQQLKRKSHTVERLQQQVRARRELKAKRNERRIAKNEIKFKLLLVHRRQQRQRNCQMLELIEILPADQLPTFEERQREYAATLVKAAWRGYRVRRQLDAVRRRVVEIRAAKKIQLAVCNSFFLSQTNRF